MFPVRRSLIQQTAKKIKRLRGLKMSAAYDEAAVEYGFKNYRHYLNSLEKSEVDLKEIAQNYLLRLFKEKYLSVPSRIFFDFEDFKFEFQNLTISKKEAKIEVNGNALIFVNTFKGKGYDDSKNTVKESRYYQCDFLMSVDSGELSLVNAKVNQLPLP